MARQLGPFDWQGRLENEGSVTFGPNRWSSWVLFAVAIAALLGFLVEIIADGVSAWSVFAVVVLAACALTTGRAALLGTSELTVTHEGFRMGRGPVVPFARLGAITLLRRNLTLLYAVPGVGQKRMIVSLPRLASYHPADLAVWLLKLKGGPSADVVVDERSGISRVFRLRADVRE
ncbi:MAG TPA: hypothetical protein VGK78_08950 [Nocardioides sp.]|uniref:hypothetical protein n=1 Tax=Nocardioides sp. TaxID=35761 RepID=UPI002F4045C8